MNTRRASGEPAKPLRVGDSPAYQGLTTLLWAQTTLPAWFRPAYIYAHEASRLDCRTPEMKEMTS